MGMGKWEGWRMVEGGNGYKSINSVAIEWQWLCTVAASNERKEASCLRPFLMMTLDLWCPKTFWRVWLPPLLLLLHPAAAEADVGLGTAEKKAFISPAKCRKLQSRDQTSPKEEMMRYYSTVVPNSSSSRAGWFWIMCLEVMWAVWCFFFVVWFRNLLQEIK